VDLRDEFERAIRARELLRAGEPVLAAVSGGVDSMVLLDLVSELAPAWGWRVSVAHFNHQLRGAESDGDEAFVRAAAERLGWEFRAGRRDVARHAGEGGISIEMAARELRHRFLAETAQAAGCGAMVLAQHADDQAETFWLKLLRGEVGAGLGGMRWSGPSPALPEVRLVRPLLGVPKRVIRDFAEAQGIRSREDSSNAAREFLRNRLRQEVIPALEAFQPRWREISLRAAEVLGAEKDFLRAEAERWLERETRPFQFLADAMQREIVRQQLVELGFEANADLIEALRAQPGRIVSVSTAESVKLNEGGRIEVRQAAREEFSRDEAEIDFTKAGSTVWVGTRLAWEVLSAVGPKEEGTEYFDAAEVGQRGRLRHWRPGDRFQPIGLEHAVKLQDLFVNMKVPAAERRRRVVAEDSEGRIFWIEGVRISERHKITASTKKVLAWRWGESAAGWK